MKKFLIAVIVLLFVALSLYYGIYYRGFYIDLNKEAKTGVQSKVEGKTIYYKNEGGNYEPLVIRGVDLRRSIPGHNANEFAVDEKTWLRWFTQIQKMGANTIRIFSIYDDTFYNAFYEYNSGRKKPLLLLQGLQVSDYDSYSGKEDYGTDFYKTLKEISFSAVDVIHGRKCITPKKTKGGGNYWKDVSAWVIGYIVGDKWNSSTIVYTNHNTNYSTSYKGMYFRTSKKAKAFEVLLAKIMDDMILYESKKYKMQRIISFTNEPQDDPFFYEKFYAKQLSKYNHLDAENIQPTDKLKSGYFASYQLYKFCLGFANYFSVDQKEKLANILPTLNQKLYYEGYTQLLAKYHSMPVVITEYGFSSSRGMDDTDGPISEEEQGKALVSTYKDIVKSGCSGALLSTWQDEWQRGSWNTSYSVDMTKNSWWQNVQSKAQGYGVLSFDSGKKKSAVYVDGDFSEWREKDRLITKKGSALSVRYDERGLYFLVKKNGLNKDTKMYIPIDITPKSGSKTSLKPKLSFERKTDFLICLEGPLMSQILVQARYESMRENYLKETEGDDPFINYPKKDDQNFVPIRMVFKNRKLVNAEMTSEEIRAAHLMNSFNTGKLIYGNSNPNSSNYNSGADFFNGPDFFEIRIPWQLLNFSNPADMLIHDDYYEKYGVEGIPVSDIYIGFGESNYKYPISMSAFHLNGWGKDVNYHERLKRSYYILKESWNK